jgi:hypothetical protein
MRLQSDSEIVIGHEAIRLRPTLGAAFRLERKYDGFHDLYCAVIEGNVTAISDVIREGTGRSSAITQYLDNIDGEPLLISLAPMLPVVADFVLALCGQDASDKSGVQGGEQIPFLEYHTKLYRLATGWLGWSPEVAWSATPAEILEAQKGRVEMLGAIFGSGKPDDENTIDLTKGRLERSARDRLNAIGSLTTQKMP